MFLNKPFLSISFDAKLPHIKYKDIILKESLTNVPISLHKLDIACIK